MVSIVSTVQVSDLVELMLTGIVLKNSVSNIGRIDGFWDSKELPKLHPQQLSQTGHPHPNSSVRST